MLRGCSGIPQGICTSWSFDSACDAQIDDAHRRELGQDVRRPRADDAEQPPAHERHEVVQDPAHRSGVAAGTLEMLAGLALGVEAPTQPGFRFRHLPPGRGPGRPPTVAGCGPSFCHLGRQRSTLARRALDDNASMIRRPDARRCRSRRLATLLARPDQPGRPAARSLRATSIGGEPMKISTEPVAGLADEDVQAKHYWSLTEEQGREHARTPPHVMALAQLCLRGRRPTHPGVRLLCRTQSQGDPRRLRGSGRGRARAGGHRHQRQGRGVGREASGLDLRVGDERQLEALADASWDVVFTISVLDHMPEPLATIESLVRIASRRIIILEPHAAVGEGLVTAVRSRYADASEATPYTYIHDYGALFLGLPVAQELDLPMPTHLVRLGPFYRFRSFAKQAQTSLDRLAADYRIVCRGLPERVAARLQGKGIERRDAPYCGWPARPRRSTPRCTRPQPRTSCWRRPGAARLRPRRSPAAGSPAPSWTAFSPASRTRWLGPAGAAPGVRFRTSGRPHHRPGAAAGAGGAQAAAAAASGRGRPQPPAGRRRRGAHHGRIALRPGGDEKGRYPPRAPHRPVGARARRDQRRREKEKGEEEEAPARGEDRPPRRSPAPAVGPLDGRRGRGERAGSSGDRLARGREATPAGGDRRDICPGQFAGAGHHAGDLQGLVPYRPGGGPGRRRAAGGSGAGCPGRHRRGEAASAFRQSAAGRAGAGPGQAERGRAAAPCARGLATAPVPARLSAAAAAAPAGLRAGAGAGDVRAALFAAADRQRLHHPVARAAGRACAAWAATSCR